MHTCIVSLNQRLTEYPIVSRIVNIIDIRKSMSTCKRMKLDHYFTQHTKINPGRNQDLSLISQTINILEEHTGKSPWHWSWKFLELDSKSTENRFKIKRWDWIKLGSLYPATDTNHENEKATDRRLENICNPIIQRRYYPKCIKYWCSSIRQKPTTKQFKMTLTILKEDIKMPNTFKNKSPWRH